jgi:hypothetical protein
VGVTSGSQTYLSPYFIENTVDKFSNFGGANPPWYRTYLMTDSEDKSLTNLTNPREKFIFRDYGNLILGKKN